MAWSIDIHLHSKSLMPSCLEFSLVLVGEELAIDIKPIQYSLTPTQTIRFSVGGADDHCNKGGVTLMFNTIHELVWYVRKSKCSHLVSLFAMPTIPIFYLFSLLQSTQPRYITVWRWGKCLCFTFHSFAMLSDHLQF